MFTELFADAVRRIYSILPENLTGTESPTKSIAEIVGSNDLTMVPRMNKRVLHYDSPRITLLRMRDDPKFVTKMSPKEREVFFLATAIDEKNTFIYTNDDIAEMTKSEAGTVEGYLTTCLKIAKSDKPRFPSRISKGGAVILENSAHFNLILMREKLTSEQLASLSVIQRKLLDFLTTPDKEGIYPRETDAQREIGITGNGLASKILESLRHPDKILDLKQKMEMALAENRDQFSTDQTKLMEHILTQIKQGRPLRPVKVGYIGWKEMCKEVNLPEFRGYSLETKLKAFYPEETSETGK